MLPSATRGVKYSLYPNGKKNLPNERRFIKNKNEN